MLKDIGYVVWGEVGRMWWFTLIGIMLAALIKTYKLDKHVRGYVGKYGLWSIVVATAVGGFSPLCSCGILPIVIPMALSGVALAPVMALLVTSPVMDPASFMLTWGGVGQELAWWKLGGAMFLGLSAGILTHLLVKAGFLSGDLVKLKPVLDREGKLAPAYDIGCANGLKLKTMNVVERESRFRFFLDRLWDVGSFVCLWVGLAILLEAIIQTLVPINWVMWLVGQEGVSSVMAATLVALPLPAHQVPVVPILAGLQAKGIAQGADAAFLMAGPVTSLPAMAALYATFKPRVVGLYITIGLVGSALIGFGRLAFS